VRVAFGASRQIEARLTVNGLVAAGSGATLPVANLSFPRGRPGGRQDQRTGAAPSRPRRPAVRFEFLSLDLTPAGRGFAISGGLTGERVELADALAVLGVFLRPRPPRPAASRPKIAASRADRSGYRATLVAFYRPTGPGR